jgi:hypothetical protein
MPATTRAARDCLGRHLLRRARPPADQHPQQTGMLFINTQQVQPDFIIAAMQAQQA